MIPAWFLSNKSSRKLDTLVQRVRYSLHVRHVPTPPTSRDIKRVGRMIQFWPSRDVSQNRKARTKSLQPSRKRIAATKGHGWSLSVGDGRLDQRNGGVSRWEMSHFPFSSQQPKPSSGSSILRGQRSATKSPSSARLPTFLGEGSPKIDVEKKSGYPYSNLCTG